MENAKKDEAGAITVIIGRFAGSLREGGINVAGDVR